MIAANEPKVSVLMSVFNGDRYLKQAIDSILNQSLIDFEFVIVDDGSSQATKEILAAQKDPRIQLIINPLNLGLTKSLNIGLAACRGKYVARMDCDDISCPNRLLKQVDYLESNEEIAVVGSQVEYIDSNGNRRGGRYWSRLLEPDELRWQCMFESPFVHSTVMMRTKIIRDTLGGYDENVQTSQDHELWSRVVDKFDCANLNEQLLKFRTHQESVSSNYGGQRVNNVRLALVQAAVNILEMRRSDCDEWAHEWIIANNQKNFDRPANLHLVYKLLLEFKDRFQRKYPVANMRSIDCHLATMIVRIAENATKINKRQSISLYSKSFKHNLLIPVSGAIRFIVKLAIR